jgi:hypothetical protein
MLLLSPAPIATAPVTNWAGGSMNAYPSDLVYQAHAARRGELCAEAANERVAALTQVSRPPTAKPILVTRRMLQALRVRPARAPQACSRAPLAEQ